MTRTRSGWLALVGALVVAIALPLAAQQGPGRGMGPGMRGGGMGGRGMGPMGLSHWIESALEHREALELTEEQVAELESLGETVKAVHAPVEEEMQKLREELRASAENRAEIVQQMRERRAAAQAAHAPFREQFQSLLDDEQMRELGAALRQERGRARRGGVVRGAPGTRGHEMAAFRRGVAFGRGFERGMARGMHRMLPPPAPPAPGKGGPGV